MMLIAAVVRAKPRNANQLIDSGYTAANGN
jgi:hypothetical protein